MLGEDLWGGAPLGPSPGGGDGEGGGGGDEGEVGGGGDGGAGVGGSVYGGGGGGGGGGADAALVVAAVDAKQWKEMLDARGWLDRSRRPATFAPDTDKHSAPLGRPASVAFPVLPGAVDILRARVWAHGVPLLVQASTRTVTAGAGDWAGDGDGEAAGVEYPEAPALALCRLRAGAYTCQRFSLT